MGLELGATDTVCFVGLGLHMVFIDKKKKIRNNISLYPLSYFIWHN